VDWSRNITVPILHRQYVVKWSVFKKGEKLAQNVHVAVNGKSGDLVEKRQFCELMTKTGHRNFLPGKSMKIEKNF